MYTPIRPRALALAAMALAGFVPGAGAHGIAGARVFVSTLQIDDPAVADEAAIPTFSWQRQPATDSQGPTNEYDLNASFSKRITDNFGVSVSLGRSWLQIANAKQASGWQNIDAGPKYQAYVNAEHEFMLSLGVDHEFGASGTASIGVDSASTTFPNVTFGKGLGDLPIGAARALAVTGQVGYAISSRGLKLYDDGTDNGGHENRYAAGMSIQYSMRYLFSQVKDYGFPDWVNNLTPLLEITYSSPANRPSTTPMQLLFAPGIAYSGDWYQLTAEMMIPGNSNTGKNIGFIAEFHVYFDDIFPRSLGTPVTNWFK